MKIGDKVRLSTTHSDGSVITFSATVRKVEADTVWVEFPKRVLSLPFPPNDGKRFAQYRLNQLTSR